MSNKELNDIFRANKGDIHGGMIETSFMLHLRPELVKDYKNLKRINLFDDNIFKRIVSAKDAFKHGYFGNPALATPEIGKMILDESIENFYHVLDNSIKNPNFAESIKSMGHKKIYNKTNFLRYVSLTLIGLGALFFLKSDKK